jgi:uncharacterized protein with NRDE domain
MCLALIAFNAHPRYRLVVAANRDEFHARPAAAAAWWDEGILAGRDLKEGGTWLGVDRGGRVAFLTNVRDPSRHDPGAPSRGALVPRLMASSTPFAISLPALVRGASPYNGFNLIAGDGAGLYWGSNRAAAPPALEPGIYGVSNHLLDTPWPKVQRTKEAFRRWCAAGRDTDDLAPLFALLHDTEPAPDAMLPATGVTLARERMLSSPFIVSPDYGTRCSTILAIDTQGEARFVERSFDPAGEAIGEVDVDFSIRSGQERPVATHRQ